VGNELRVHEDPYASKTANTIINLQNIWLKRSGDHTLVSASRFTSGGWSTTLRRIRSISFTPSTAESNIEAG
jgi:hypothetical protein